VSSEFYLGLSMFLELAHTRLTVFTYSEKLVIACYLLTRLFPTEERFVMSQQIRRASLSVHLNIAEGASRKSVTERRRFFEIARGSLIETDTIIFMATKLNFISAEQTAHLKEIIIQTFKLLTGMLK
jgi:four helix bundle protein